MITPAQCGLLNSDPTAGRCSPRFSTDDALPWILRSQAAPQTHVHGRDRAVRDGSGGPAAAARQSGAFDAPLTVSFPFLASSATFLSRPWALASHVAFSLLHVSCFLRRVVDPKRVSYREPARHCLYRPNDFVCRCACCRLFSRTRSSTWAREPSPLRCLRPPPTARPRRSVLTLLVLVLSCFVVGCGSDFVPPACLLLSRACCASSASRLPPF